MMIKNVIGIAQEKKLITLEKELLDITDDGKDRHFGITDNPCSLLYFTDLHTFQKYIVLLKMRQNKNIIMYKLKDFFLVQSFCNNELNLK